MLRRHPAGAGEVTLKPAIETADYADERGYQKITEYQGFTGWVTRLKRGLFCILFYTSYPLVLDNDNLLKE
jgi:hypothetical protein